MTSFFLDARLDGETNDSILNSTIKQDIITAKEQILSGDVENQYQGLTFFLKSLSNSKDSAYRILLSDDSLVTIFVGLAMRPPTDEIMKTAFECLVIVADLNICTDAIEKTPSFVECLVALLGQGCVCIDSVINLICFLFDDSESRKSIFENNIVQVVSSVPEEVDTSKIITMILKYHDFNDEIVHFLDKVFSWLDSDKASLVSQGFLVFSDLIQKSQSNPSISNYVNFGEVHEKALVFVKSDNVEVLTSAFDFLNSCGTIEEADFEACCECFGISDQSAQSAVKYLDRMKEYWLEENSNNVGNAILGTIGLRQFNAKRVMMSLLVKCLPHMEIKEDQNLVLILGPCLSDQLLGNIAIKALALVGNMLSSSENNEWFFSSLEEYIEEITDYSNNSDPSVADDSKALLEMISTYQ